MEEDSASEKTVQLVPTPSESVEVNTTFVLPAPATAPQPGRQVNSTKTVKKLKKETVKTMKGQYWQLDC